MSKVMSEVSKRASELAQQSARAKQVVRSKQTSERCERTSERKSEWPSTAVWILGYSDPQWIPNSCLYKKVRPSFCQSSRCSFSHFPFSKDHTFYSPFCDLTEPRISAGGATDLPER